MSTNSTRSSLRVAPLLTSSLAVIGAGALIAAPVQSMFESGASASVRVHSEVTLYAQDGGLI